MTSRQISLAIVATVAITFPTPQASAQCEPTWGLDMLPTTGLRGYISVMSTCDIGNGPSLYAAGVQLTMNSIDFNGVAVFNGAEWKTLGAGVGGTIQAMLPFNDGSGTALYVGGAIWLADGAPVITLARWNGNTWFGIPGVPGTVTALGIHADESGPALYAACVVSTTGPAITQIARWNGSSWSAVGSNIAVSIRALQSFDDGHGQALFAAGYRVGGTGATFPIMFRWDGQSWLQTTNESDHPSDGTILSASFNALQVFDDGSGPALYAAGRFSWSGQKPIRGIARWSGTNWFAVGTGIEGSVQALASIHDSLGSGLCAAGSIRVPGSPTSDYVLRWDGTTWAPVDPNPHNAPFSLAVFNLGLGDILCAGLSNGNGVVQLDSGSWTQLSAGHGGLSGTGSYDQAYAQAVFDDGTGDALYVGGRFIFAGGTQIPSLARWNGKEFSRVGAGISGVVLALKVFDDGTGPALYAGGWFQSAGKISANNIARWDGTTWTALGTGIDDVVWTLEVFDDGTGPALFAAGAFESAGERPARNIAKWNGKQWAAVGSGTDDLIYRLKSFSNENGSFLYACGRFFTAGGVEARALARWDGKSWSAVGAGLTVPSQSSVGALAVHDDGTGPALYVSGYFTAAGGVPARNIARWNGLTWSSVGNGLGDYLAWDLASFDDGAGLALYAGGYFESAGNFTASELARWDGQTWRPVGTGVYLNNEGNTPTAVYSLQPFDDGHGPALFIGGHFGAIDGHYFQNIAKLIRSAPESPTLLAATPSQNVCSGVPVVLAVNAVGVPPLIYQWRKNAENLVDGPGVTGANSPQLILTDLNPNSQDAYDCLVTDAECEVISAVAHVSVAASAPTITRQPQAAVAHAGEQVTLWVGIDNSGGASYQWRKNGIPLVPSARIQGTDETYLAFVEVVPADTANYDCVITNPCGTTTSNPARLTVLASVPPPGKPIGPIPANPG